MTTTTPAQKEFTAIRLKLDAAQRERPADAASGGEFLAAAALSRELLARAIGASIMNSNGSPEATERVITGYAALQQTQLRLEKALDDFAVEFRGLLGG